jgi:23S rRNA-intervening sequence protein
VARHDHLPIFRKAFDLAIYLERTVQGFSRYHRYAVGADMRAASRGVMRTIIRANSSVDRRALLQGLRVQLEELLVLVRLAKEVRAFTGLAAYEYCANEVLALARQNEGWLRSLEKGRPESVPRSSSDVGT